MNSLWLQHDEVTLDTAEVSVTVLPRLFLDHISHFCNSGMGIFGRGIKFLSKPHTIINFKKLNKK